MCEVLLVQTLTINQNVYIKDGGSQRHHPSICGLTAFSHLGYCCVLLECATVSAEYMALKVKTLVHLKADIA